jgi:hypothetical protein
MVSLVPRQVTTQQWASYWGMNQKEKLQRILESVLVAYGGAWLAWFLSFMAGGYVAAFTGTALVFNWMYTPWLNAKKRNAKFWPTEQRLSYALFIGRIKRFVNTFLIIYFWYRGRGQFLFLEIAHQHLS